MSTTLNEINITELDAGPEIKSLSLNDAVNSFLNDSACPICGKNCQYWQRLKRSLNRKENQGKGDKVLVKNPSPISIEKNLINAYKEYRKFEEDLKDKIHSQESIYDLKLAKELFHSYTNLASHLSLEQDKNHFNDKALLKNYPDSLKSALVLAEWTKEYHGKYDNFINDIKSDNWTSAAINFHLGMEKVPLNDLIYKEIYNYWDKTSLKDESERIISASIEFSNYFANKYSENIEEGIKNAEKEFKKNYNKSLRYNAKKAQQRVQKYVEKVNQKNPQALKDLDNISNLKKINENLKKAAKFTGIISSIKDYYDLAEGFRNGIKSNDWEPFLKTSAQIGASALMSMLVASMITGPTTIGSIIISAAFISIGGYIISLASR